VIGTGFAGVFGRVSMVAMSCFDTNLLNMALSTKSWSP